MALFDNLSKTLAKTGQGAVQKTKDATEVARITREIDRMEGEISILYSKIGIQYYKEHANDEECELGEFIHEVTRLRQTIAGSKEAIKRIKGVVKCPNCNAEVPNNVLFCGSCGFRMPRQDMVVCANCNSSWPKGTLFCSKCGSKIGDGAQPRTNSAPARRLCATCGAVIVPGTLFCASCGSRIEIPNEKEPVAASERVHDDSTTAYSIEVDTTKTGKNDLALSEDLGQRSIQTRTCPICGTALEGDDCFCSNCGNRI